MRSSQVTLLFILSLIMFSCTSLVLKPADYSWPLESVLKVSEDGVVKEGRYTFTLNVKNLFMEEFQHDGIPAEAVVRIIRDQSGYYYLTTIGFMNVYVFENIEGGMSLISKIELPEKLTEPAMNQRTPNIELINGTNKYLLNKEGILR